MKRSLLVLLASLCAPLAGQITPSSGAAQTKGVCSPAVTGNNNTFNITCTGIREKLGSQLVDLLNRVAKNQLDAETILSKLDVCLEKQAARHLSDWQKQIILEAMRPFRGKRVTIIATDGDPEAYDYASEFVSLFRAAELTLVAFSGDALRTGVNPMMMEGGPPNNRCANTTFR